MGASLGASVHAMAKALLFASLAAPEAEGNTLIDGRGLASRHRLAGAGFIVGALSILGVPPTAGYAGHWRVFAVVSGNPLLFAALASAAMLSAAIYARVIASFWWGSGSTTGSKATGPHYNRPVLGVALTLLMLALVIAGLWPQLLQG
jgi:NADH:ubiquinone oxidoreductase subunit 2 (subunit N)